MLQTRLPSLMEQQAASDTQAQSRLPSLGGTEIPFNLPEPPKDEEPRDYGWGITTAFKRGFERLKSLPDVAQGDYEELAMHFENMEKYDLSERDKERMQELQNTDGWWEAFAYYAKNPSLIAQVVAESLPMSVAPIAGGVGGGLAGGAAGSAVPAVGNVAGAIGGTVTGAALGSYATEYLASITDYFGRQGIDMTNPNQLRQAFSDQQIMSDARDFANKRGIPVAIFDGLSFGLAGRIYKPASALVKGVARPIVGSAAELGMQAGAGMAGEAGAQLSSVGKIEDIPGVWAEGFGEIVPGIVEAGANHLMSNRAEQVRGDSLSQQLDADLTAEEEAAILAKHGITDKLSYQAMRSQQAKESLQIQQYQQMAATAKRKYEGQALAIADLETVARESERLSNAFMENELQREQQLEAQRREAEYQQELQKGEASAAIAPYEEPTLAKSVAAQQRVSGEKAPNTAMADALAAAQTKKTTQEGAAAAAASEKLAAEGQEIAPDELQAPEKPVTSKPTKTVNVERDSFLTTRAKLPAKSRLSQQAFAAEGLDLEQMRQPYYRDRPAFSKHKEAMGPDDVAEYLNENDFPSPDGKPWDADSALNAVVEEFEGRTPLLTGSGMQIAATEAAYAEELGKFEQETARREEKGPPKVWQIEVDGLQARVSEDPDGDVEVTIGADTTITERVKGESNADMVRAVISAQTEQGTKAPAKAAAENVTEGKIETKGTQKAKETEKGKDVTLDELVTDVRSVLEGLTKTSSENEKAPVRSIIRLMKKQNHPDADALQKEFEKAIKKSKPTYTDTLGSQITKREKVEKTYEAKPGKGDLFGQDTGNAQALADQTDLLDRKRSTGQDDLETGDPTDMFSAASKQRDIEDVTAEVKKSETDFEFDDSIPFPDTQEKSREKAFIALADSQRGAPEAAMLKASKTLGGGVGNVAIEHVGDLTHRMTERYALDAKMGYEFVLPKVKRALTMLRQGYGFGREFEENIDANASMRKVSREELAAQIKTDMLAYAAEHKKLKVHNEMQRAARDAAVALGEQNWLTATKNLETLERVLDKGPDAWAEEAGKFESKPSETFEDFDAALEAAGARAATSPKNDIAQPSKAQKETGNYKKAHARIAGLDVTIENPKGTVRRGQTMKDHYGYVKRTEGADGDQVDVFVSPEVKQVDRVFVIDQTKEDGVTFDEHKVMIGYGNQLDAVRGYKRNYSQGWKVGPVTEMSMPEFKAWLTQDTTKPINKPASRHQRKFVRSQKGLRYSVPAANKALLEDAKKHVPGADAAFIKLVIGKPTPGSDPMIQKMIDHVLSLEDKVAKTTTGPMTKAEVEAAIAPLAKKFPGVGAVVHESVSEMPDSPLKQSMLNNIGNAGVMPVGIYDVLTDQVHMFADRFKKPSDAMRNFLHEGVAHKGLRILFNKTLPNGTVVVDQIPFNALMTDVYENATNRKQIQQLEHKYTLGPNITTRDKLIVGEEYIAWMAESGKDVSLFQRVVAAVRKQLRKLKIVEAWTDNDINNLLREVRSAMPKGKPISEITLKEEVTVEETGEVFEIETDAEVALRQHDKRVSVIEKLRGCL